MSKALAARGHRVIVACYHHGRGEIPQGVELLRTPHLPGYARMRAGPDLVKPALDLALLARLVGLGARPDIVHAHNYEAPIAAYLSRAWTGVPVVYNNHNIMAEELPQYFQGRGSRRFAGRLGRLLDRQIPRRAQATVAISERAVPVLRALGCSRVRQIPPGVDPADFEGARGRAMRASMGLSARTWVVYAGNPDPYQDLGVLIDAVLGLPELGLIMVSSSDLSEWQKRAEALPLSRKRFVRAQSWAEVRDIISAADMAALPRTVCTGYPIKLLNYLGLGLPTVCAEGSAQNLAGVVRVPNHDPRAFGAALQALASDPARRQTLGQKARAGVLADCTWDTQAQKLEALYAQVLSDH